MNTALDEIDKEVNLEVKTFAFGKLATADSIKKVKENIKTLKLGMRVLKDEFNETKEILEDARDDTHNYIELYKDREQKLLEIVEDKQLYNQVRQMRVDVYKKDITTAFEIDYKRLMKEKKVNDNTITELIKHYTSEIKGDINEDIENNLYGQ